MIGLPLGPAPPDAVPASPGLFVALERAAGAFARLDQALADHPLRAAFLYRVRLEAVRRQAAVDGHGIDPWHLAATIEGLRLRMDHALGVVDRGAVFDAARTAFRLHQWITAPDADQEDAVRAAERHLAAPPLSGALLAAATRTHAWLWAGGTRAPIRAALIRFWVRQRLLHAPVPLTGPRAFAAEAPAALADWGPAFLDALADEARDYHLLLAGLERGGLAARARVAGRRSTSRAAAAVDVLAAAPLISATMLAGAIGMSVKGASELLDDFVAEGVAVEMTHRSARRLFGLHGLAPLREATAPPRRPVPGRGRGRPPIVAEPGESEVPPVALPPVGRRQRPLVDYAALEAAMAQCDQAIRSARRRLDEDTRR
jgi:hypothetical protein